MDIIDWNDIADDVSAGSICNISFSKDLATINISIISVRCVDNLRREISIIINCHDCYYFDFKRLYDHEPGAGSIWEAYIKDSSPLIDALHTNKLEGIAGSLYVNISNQKRVLHFEIIGEVSINILCQSIVCDYDWITTN